MSKRDNERFLNAHKKAQEEANARIESLTLNLQEEEILRTDLEKKVAWALGENDALLENTDLYSYRQEQKEARNTRLSLTLT